jgi:hypothetical protein
MPTSEFSDALSRVSRPDESELAKIEQRLPPLLSVIAGMVDLTGFFTLGSCGRLSATFTGTDRRAASAASSPYVLRLPVGGCSTSPRCARQDMSLIPALYDWAFGSAAQRFYGLAERRQRAARRRRARHSALAH